VFAFLRLAEPFGEPFEAVIKRGYRCSREGSPPSRRKWKDPTLRTSGFHLKKKGPPMTSSSWLQPSGWNSCVHSPRRSIVQASPLVVIILVLAQQWLSRVEVSVILGR
jgi:hypothetical protein